MTAKKLALPLNPLLLLLALLAPPAFAEPQRFRLSSEQSQITSKITDPFGKVVNGTFRLIQGEAYGDPARLVETASVVLEIDAASYNSSIGLRDQDVVEYSLNFKQHPLSRFNGAVVDNAERDSQAGWRVTVKGRLELNGVPKEIVVPLRLLYQQNRIVARGSFRVSLAEFNIAIPQLLFWKAGHQAEIDFRLVGERQP